MPMVPQYNNGAPSVADAGKAGVAPVSFKGPDFDYASTMAKAMQPLNDVSNTFAKMAEIEHAREIKAESDDAETKVIRFLNESMTGENGYMLTQNKDARDGFKPFEENLKKGVEGILEGLSPQVRQAVDSRVQQRMISALSRASVHRATQTQSYNITSSQGRIDAMVDDYAVNRDPAYQQKTAASLMQEIDYQASILGMDAEQTKALKNKTLGLAQVKMFSVWAIEDPVAAFAAFTMQRGQLDPDVSLKLENTLFGGARDLLAQSLANRAQEGSGFEQADHSGAYNTKLTDDEEKQFQQWAKETGREKDVIDYDLRGAWKDMQSGAMAADDRGHLGDKYKKPNHPTFSNQSIYASEINNGGIWTKEDGKDVFTVAVDSKSEAEYLERYFKKNEPEAVLNVSVKAKPSWMDNPLAPTGDAFIDSLPEDQRFQIAFRAGQLFKKERSEYSNQLRVDVSDSLAQVLATGEGDPLTPDQFYAALGFKDGQKAYGEYTANFNTNKTVFEIKTMTNEQIAETVSSSKVPAGTPGFAAHQKRHEQIVKAASSVLKARAEDPVGAMIESGVTGYAQLDFSKPGFADQLKTRVALAPTTGASFGAGNLLLSKSEAKAMTSALDSMTGDQQAAFLTHVYDAVGKEAMPLLYTQIQSDRTNYAIAMSGMGDFFDRSGVSVGEKYLKGRDAIKNGLVVLDTAKAVGDLATIRSQLDTTYSDDPDKIVEGVFTNKQALDSTIELITGVYGYEMLADSSADSEKAIKRSIGEIHEYNKKKIILPRGLDDDDFEDRLEKIAGERKEPLYVKGYGKYEAKDIPGLFTAVQLQTERDSVDGGVIYSVSFNGLPVMEKVKNEKGEEVGVQLYIEVKK